MSLDKIQDLAEGRLAIDAHNRDAALLHLIHDYGTDGEHFIMTHYNPEKIIAGIIAQRQQMDVAGILYSDQVAGSEQTLSGRIDLEKLGLSAEDIENIRDMQAHEFERKYLEPRYTAAVSAPTSYAARAEATKGSGFDLARGGDFSIKRGSIGGGGGGGG